MSTQKTFNIIFIPSHSETLGYFSELSFLISSIRRLTSSVIFSSASINCFISTISYNSISTSLYVASTFSAIYLSAPNILSRYPPTFFLSSINIYSSVYLKITSCNSLNSLTHVCILSSRDTINGVLTITILDR